MREKSLRISVHYFKIDIKGRVKSSILWIKSPYFYICSKPRNSAEDRLFRSFSTVPKTASLI